MTTLETRRLGKTGHLSTVVTFGVYAIGNLPQDDADRAIEHVLARGLNHFDVAPSYAEAEQRLGDYLHRNPQPHVFISCKTEVREAKGAREELLRTIERMGRDSLDLYQLHAICTMDDLEKAFAPGGSMEMIVAARDEGLVKHIGITGHGWESPAVHRAALDRFPFATVMTSHNRFMAQNAEYGKAWFELVETCMDRDVGIHVLKATAKGPWKTEERPYGTWYEPLTAQEDVDRAVAWVLQQPVTTICSAGDMQLFDGTCDAAEHYTEVHAADIDRLVTDAGYGDFFAAD